MSEAILTRAMIHLTLDRFMILETGCQKSRKAALRCCLPQPYPGPAPVLRNEFYPGRFKGSTDRFQGSWVGLALPSFEVRKGFACHAGTILKLFLGPV